MRDPDQVRAVVREVMSRPEFRPPERSLVERIYDWVLEAVGRLLAALGGSGAGGIVGLVLLALVLVGVGVLAARFSRGLTPSPEVAAALPGGPRRSAAEWRAEAEAHERAGAWRQAVRCRYRALVADLASRGLVEEVPGRTAGEYRREVRRALPGAAAEFADATELFELAWYARSPPAPGRRPACATCPTTSSSEPGRERAGRGAGRGRGGCCRGSRSWSGWRWWWWSAGGAGEGAPLDPASPGPLGTKALVEVLRELGGEVASPPSRQGTAPRPRCCSATT